MNTAVKYGLMLAGVGTLTFLITAFAIPKAALQPFSAVGSVIWVATTALTVFFAYRMRAEDGGTYDFGQAFINVFIMCLIYGVVMVVLTTQVIYFIIPNVAEVQREIAMEWSMSMMSMFGEPSDEMIEAVEEATEQQTFGPSIWTLLPGLLSIAFSQALFALVMGFILKNKKAEQL